MRVAVLCVYCLVASAAIAEDLRPEQARAFVVGKLFAYSCFDGTAGMGRIMAAFQSFITSGGIRPPSC